MGIFIAPCPSDEFARWLSINMQFKHEKHNFTLGKHVGFPRPNISPSFVWNNNQRLCMVPVLTYPCGPYGGVSQTT